MILYFSGTGNSLHVTETLSALLHERTYCMEQSPCQMPALADDEPLGIIFPVYAWGLPSIVTTFLRQLTVGERYVWTVMTCGDDMGYADRILEKTLHHKVNAAFSVQMPNTYVCLPGFDVDPQDLANAKRQQTDQCLPLIAKHIEAKDNVIQLHRGAAAWLKTYVLRPLFNRYLVTDKYFKTNHNCTSCGLCIKHCPVQDIQLQDGQPAWRHHNCTGCLRCYHHCPQRAIEWGRYTLGKGQKR